MTSIRRYTTLLFMALVTMVLGGGCSQEDIDSLPKGTLHLNIGHTSQKADTRANPHQLGKPMAEMFSLQVQRTTSQGIFYDGQFVEDLELPVGNYSITAYYGEDVVIGRDCPYYEGKASASIEEDQSTSVLIPCRVANALVSVAFGRDEEEKQRFSKHYSDYGVLVRVGDHSLEIPYDDTESSIYFPAGSSPELYFYGTLKEEDRFVSYELTSEALPETFEAADHAIVTLSLPAPESSTKVNITKVDMVTVALDETIPLSWLPLSVATAQHRYDETSGELVGTDVTFSNSYPGMQWKAVVTNANEEEVRTIVGSGELVSEYSSSSEWPYLPSGNYKATYYIVNGEKTNKIGSRDFSVGSPELSVTVDGYSAHTKYLEGDIDGANACDRSSIYNLSVKVNISEVLLAKHDYSFTYTYAGVTENVPTGKNAYSVDAITNQAVSLTPYRLRVDVSFDGASASNHKDFYITGLPVNYTPPTEAAGWVGAGTVSFENSKVVLGKNTVTEGQSIVNTDIAIPNSTTISFDYDVMVNTMWVGTELTITVGSDEFLWKNVGAGVLVEEHPYSGTEVKTLTAAATELKCFNTYGAGQTYSCIYSLSLKYSK